MKPFEIFRTQNRLELTRSKTNEFIGFVVLGAFFCAFSISVFNTDFSSVNSLESFFLLIKENPTYIFFGILGVLLFSQVCSSLKFILCGEKFVFDAVTREVTKNKSTLLKFSDIKTVQIRVYSGDSDSYDLALLTNTGDSNKVADFNDLSYVKELAGNVADLIGIKVIIKE